MNESVYLERVWNGDQGAQLSRPDGQGIAKSSDLLAISYILSSAGSNEENGRATVH